MTVKPISSLEEFKKIIAEDKHSVFDFWATWCGPCRMISPVFEQLAQKPENEHVQFYKVDVDEAPEIAQEVGIRAMPTFLLFKSGEQVGSTMGANPPQLQALVQKAV